MHIHSHIVWYTLRSLVRAGCPPRSCMKKHSNARSLLVMHAMQKMHTCEASATMSSGDLTLATSRRMLLCRPSIICCMATISPLPCMTSTWRHSSRTAHRAHLTKHSLQSDLHELQLQATILWLVQLNVDYNSTGEAMTVADRWAISDCRACCDGHLGASFWRGLCRAHILASIIHAAQVWGCIVSSCSHGGERLVRCVNACMHLCTLLPHLYICEQTLGACKPAAVHTAP